MTKRKRPPTLADIAGGAKITPKQRREIQAALTQIPEAVNQYGIRIRETLQEFSRFFTSLRIEAEALFDAVDGADLPTIERYVRDHPPSPGAIGFLVLIARDRYKSEVARRNAMRRIAERAPAKAFVLQEWAKPGAAGKGKADFSRVIHARMKHEFPNVEIGADTIARDWLPKGKPARRGPR